MTLTSRPEWMRAATDAAYAAINPQCADKCEFQNGCGCASALATAILAAIAPLVEAEVAGEREACAGIVDDEAQSCRAGAEWNKRNYDPTGATLSETYADQAKELDALASRTNARGTQ